MAEEDNTPDTSSHRASEEAATEAGAPQPARGRPGDWLLLLLLTATSLPVHGYHLGHEDQAIWLPAVKKQLDPSLYPFDSTFFLAQTQLSLFDKLVAFSIRVTHLPVDWAVFLWHLLTIFLVLAGCLLLARRCFARPAAQWGAVTAVWAARLMIASGSQIPLMDRYLHPRDLATAAILLALVAVLDRKFRALAWLALAAVIHPTMAIIGAAHLAFQAWPPRVGGSRTALASVMLFAPLLLPLAMIGPETNPAWRAVLHSRTFLFPLQWHWYEWLGVVVPLGMLVWYARAARRTGRRMVAHISARVALAGGLGVAGALVITTVPALERLVPAEPMRVLHLVYLLWILLGGGLLGEYVLRDRPVRWLLFLAPVCLVFVLADVLVYPSSPHVEWPGRLPNNAWVEAFDWARRNTPHNAIFALAPDYLRRSGNDRHGFRAFAERSALADGVKDWAVAANSPELAFQWRQQTVALSGWYEFKLADFRALRRQFGVTWVVLEKPGVAGLSCPYTNGELMVCRTD